MAKRKKRGLLSHSSIPYAQRLKMQKQAEIISARDHAARIAMYCTTVALHDLEGIGYKRLVRFALHHKSLVSEFYEDPEVGLVHCKQRMEQLGLPIEGEFYTAPAADGETKYRQDIKTNALQAIQAALYLGAIAANDVFGFGSERQHRLWDCARTYSTRYAKEGVDFLLEEMAKIGFPIENGRAMYYTDDTGQVVTPAAARKMCNG